MKKILLSLIVALCFVFNASASSKKSTQSQDLIVLAAPSIVDTLEDKFYARVFQGIVDFDIAGLAYGLVSDGPGEANGKLCAVDSSSRSLMVLDYRYEISVDNSQQSAGAGGQIAQRAQA